MDVVCHICEIKYRTRSGLLPHAHKYHESTIRDFLKDKRTAEERAEAKRMWRAWGDGWGSGGKREADKRYREDKKLLSSPPSPQLKLLISMTIGGCGLLSVGGMFFIGGGIFPHSGVQALAAVCVLFANTHIFGGIVLLKNMFRGATDPPEPIYLYTIPTIILGGGFLCSIGASTNAFVAVGYLVSSLLYFASPRGHAACDKHRGSLGMIGTGAGIVTSLCVAELGLAVLLQYAIVSGVGAALAQLHTGLPPQDQTV
ncbi:hypothetical protein BDK51DRAFT_36764 [Blyttiomyces helicus]|uniref:proton-translocating NAD(P)(+) transhydrogenase n=1 Tax=Blyttiomyces helicus TaxID=388810 RepID=A0A4P9W062_9FUNG|nr:hypothetical protein BDK51DRAFT_36764 [Blyttiomyces helicus]|eukprot:RKO84058.1 hypothetical protein BDK51DRAFT_36764 [Blyttiomyces helicus]